jgi:hypothetical protein
MGHFRGTMHTSRRPSSGLVSGLAPETFVYARREPTHAEIAERAYLIWESRGRRDGSPWEDWFRAERELREGRVG